VNNIGDVWVPPYVMYEMISSFTIGASSPLTFITMSSGFMAFIAVETGKDLP